MQDLYQLEHQETVSQEYENVLFEGICNESFQAKGMDRIRTFGVFIKDKEKKFFGGVKGITYYGCLYVDMLWIHTNLRHQGWGTKLMLEAEKIGKERKVSFATVNTMDWEALPFYQKLGYEIEFTREGYEKNSKMFFLRKKL